MQTLNNPDVLESPIADQGQKNTIPVNPTGTYYASQKEGFPAITMLPIASGGEPPLGEDMNGMLNLTSQHHFFLQNGGQETFRQDVSDAIGGYPQGAILWYKPAGTTKAIPVQSLIANNIYNFNTDPSYIDGVKWTYAIDVETNKSNCITEVPQDIKLELNSGTLTLKAGSKVYNANGLLATTTNDLNTTWASTGTVYVVVTANGQSLTIANYPGETVSTLPSPATNYKLYFNTTDGKCYFDNGSMIEMSFPVAIVTANGQINSIKQVFNGFGYIGSTTFVLPGVRGLIPNGRKADGTCKNTEISFANVTVNTFSSFPSSSLAFLDNTGVSYYSDRYYVSMTKPAITQYTNRWYDTTNNIIWDTTDTGATWTQYNGVFLGTMFKALNNPQITSLTPSEPFKAIGSSDILALMNMIYPVGAVYLTVSTATACPIASLIPGSKWAMIATGRALWGGNGSNAGTTIAAGLPNVVADGSGEQICTTTYSSGAIQAIQVASHAQGGGNTVPYGYLTFDASRNSSIYGASSTVQPPAYRVNVWQRTE